MYRIKSKEVEGWEEASFDGAIVCAKDVSIIGAPPKCHFNTSEVKLDSSLAYILGSLLFYGCTLHFG